MNEQESWHAPDWSCRQPVLIDNSAGSTDLTDYQVKVTLTAPDFDFAAAAADGADLRFTDTDGATLLDCWIESFSKPECSAVVWVKVPHIPAASTKTIHLFSGNTRVASASDGERTFEFFDDCETGSADDRWEVALGSPTFSYVNCEEEFSPISGIWHISDCTRRLSPTAATVYGGAHATYCAWTRPMAVYAPDVDKTFFAFGDRFNSPAVSFYDHRTCTLGPATVIDANTDIDAHRNPHILIDEHGYVYLFYGSHCTPTLVKKSLRPWDCSEFQDMATITNDSSYPQPWQLRPGEITVLYRARQTHDAAQSSIKSSDGGQSWQQAVDIVTPRPENGVYAVSIAENGPYPRKVHMAWSLTRGDWWQRYHIFYAYSDDGAVTWRNSDGTPCELPITESTSEMIFESDIPDRGVWLKDIQLDPQGNPCILFIDGHTVTYGCIWNFARHTPDGWSIHEIARSDHMFDGGSIVILADDDFRVYAPTTISQPYEDGGEIEEWQSTDGGQTWTNTKHVTTGSTYSHNHVKTVFNHASGDFRVFWSYGDAKNPPETRHVDLYYYGEDQPQPQKMDLHAASIERTGRCLKLTQDETIPSAIKISGLQLHDVALSARVRTGVRYIYPPMVCLGINDAGHFYGVGMTWRGITEICRCTDECQVMAAGAPKTSATWRDWSFQASAETLRLVVDGEELVSATEPDLPAGGIGAHVSCANLYLDDIRVRKCATPEPTANLQPPSPS